MERTPSRRQLAKSTRGLRSASWHSMISPVRTASAEMPVSFCSRTPRSGAVRAGAGATNNLVARPQRDGGAGGARKMLRTFSNGTDGRLEIQLGGMNVHFLAHRDGPEIT